jgi:hypothetical protein
MLPAKPHTYGGPLSRNQPVDVIDTEMCFVRLRKNSVMYDPCLGPRID